MSSGTDQTPWQKQERGRTPRPRRTVTLAVGGAVVAACLAAPAAGAASATGATEARQVAVVRYLEATLRGTAEGDPNGTGHVELRLDRQRARVCAAVTYRRIGAPSDAHIHRASDGGVVVPLTGSVTDGASCTTGVSRPLIRRILERPRRYYFNVHNTAYPAGAIQGTLHR